MGAQFIHGQVKNPIFNIAVENSLIPEIYKNSISETDGNYRNNKSFYLKN